MAISLNRLLNIKSSMKKSKQILDKINRIKETTPNYYIGKVIRISPLLDSNGRVKTGSRVITPRGVGEILSQWPDTWDGKPGKRLHIQLKKYPKAFRIEEVTQLAIYHEPAEQFILLSPQCYNNIGENEQLVRYRITNRKYAMLTDSYKNETEKYVLINSIRNGNLVLRNLQKNGIKLTTPNEEDLTWEDIKLLINDTTQRTKRRWFQFRKTVIERIHDIMTKAYDIKH